MMKLNKLNNKKKKLNILRSLVKNDNDSISIAKTMSSKGANLSLIQLMPNGYISKNQMTSFKHDTPKIVEY